MTDEELQERWSGALVKEDASTHRCGIVETAKAMGGLTMLTGRWADGSRMRCSAGGVSVLSPMDIQRTYLSRAELSAECRRLRDIVADGIRALRRMGQ